jgi:hypothetical protein
MESRKAFLLRMDPELWRELDAWAQSELRSVNGQIEYLLKQAVQRRKRSDGEQQDAADQGGTPDGAA